jgi:hypothetical protein
LPSLALNAGTSLVLYMLPTNQGYVTNIVSALALEPDPNSNNIITNVTFVNQASAELGVSLTGSTSSTLIGGNVLFSIGVSNQGVSEALDVVATLNLPPGFVPATTVFSPSSGTATTTATNSNGITVTWTNISNVTNGLTVGSLQTLNVAAKATTPGVGVCTLSAVSSVYDPLKGSSFALFSVTVEQPSLGIASATQPFVLTWSSAATNYTLQGAVNLPPPGATNEWINIPAPPVVNNQYTFTLSGTNIYHFFRLSGQVP